MSEENNSSVESQETQTPVGEQHQSDDNVDYKSL